MSYDILDVTQHINSLLHPCADKLLHHLMLASDVYTCVCM